MSTPTSLKEVIAVGLLKKLAAAKRAAGESLGSSQDAQGVQQAQQAAPKAKTLQELMGTPDVQKWFRGSVGGLAKRSKIPYALLQPGMDPQTNLEQQQLKQLLQQLLAAKTDPTGAAGTAPA